MAVSNYLRGDAGLTGLPGEKGKRVCLCAVLYVLA